MANRIVSGLIAGAAGNVAFSMATHLDMLVRGRAASSMPREVAAKVADEIGLPLDFELDSDDAGAQAATDNRSQALGALLGHANALGIGLSYGIVRLAVPRPPTWLAGALLGALSMAANDYPAARLGVTEPLKWSPERWVADVLPHMAYGVVAAVTFEAARNKPGR